MNDSVKLRILNEIRSADRIFVMRHFHPDGDAIGSSKGLQAVLRAAFPKKDVRVVNADGSDYLAFLGSEDTASDEEFAEALIIVLDTATADRVSDKRFSLGRKIIKIDHHVPGEDYGDIIWTEKLRSSVSEMIADLCLSFPDVLPIPQKAAYFLYTGMVTDSGCFKFSCTTGNTLRLAAALLDQGIDTESLHARLGLEDFNYYRFQSAAYGAMKITEHGVVYLYVDKAMQKEFGLSQEQSGASVSLMEGIRGSLIWLAFIDNDDGSVRVRLRSRFVNVRELAEKYHGGGHDRASGATIYSRREMEQLIAEADALVSAYKAQHTGWL